ncbi:MAG: TPM domain-containing protein [Sphingopyxis sp.]
MWLAVVATMALLAGAWPAAAQTFPALANQRVVDEANILSPTTETALTSQLAALETQSRRQFVVATVADLQGYDIADYSYRLGRNWGIGDSQRNDGIILLIAPNERKINIAVGYGLEPVLTDAMSASIIRNSISPRFRAGDFDGGVVQGVNAIARQITLPPDEARAIAQQARADAQQAGKPSIGSVLFWLVVLLLILFIMSRGQSHGGRRRKSGHGGGPIIIWGNHDDDDDDKHGGFGGGGFGGGGFGGGGGSFGGGFSGGGGSFGGGGASGGW